MKINGFVTLKREFIWNQGSAILVRIEDKRKEYKQKIIEGARSRFMKKNWIQNLFGIQKKELSDEQVWAKLEKEAEDTFFGAYPSYWVEEHYKTLENTINEVMAASASVEEMLVSSEVAVSLNRGEFF